LQNFNTTGVAIKLSRIKYYDKMLFDFFFASYILQYGNLIFIGILRLITYTSETLES